MAYNKNTDYQELINKAVANKDYVSAAKYEQQRNEKIADANASGTNTWNAAPTNNYSNWLNYSGSANSVGTNSLDQESIKAQMNANSQAWHGATPEAKESLHAQNEYLASQLGGTVAYDANTGYWSGDAAKKQTPSQSVSDLSSYINDMYSAQKKAALAELDAAYNKNLASINRAGVGLSEAYQNARNQTAGASELAKRNNAQYAAAYGLNTGTGGQMELARNVTLQNNLNNINTTEAQSLADLDLQRNNAEIEYNNAIAQAEAQGDYALANALYQEKVRVQETLLELQVQQAQMAYNAYRDSVADNQWQQTFDFNVNKYQDSLLNNSSGNTGGSDTSKLSLSDAKTQFNNGVFTSAGLQALYDAGWTDEAIKGVYGFDAATLKPGDTPVVEVSDNALTFARFLYNSTKDPNYVYSRLKSSGYSDQEIDALMAALGL